MTKKIIYSLLSLCTFLTFSFTTLALAPFEGGPITSPFGPRSVETGSSYHKGIDIGVDGVDIKAPAKGRIQKGLGAGYDAWVEFTFGEGSPYAGQSLLFGDLNPAHMESLGLGYKDVEEGEIIGRVEGYNPAVADGPHAHVEYRIQGPNTEPSSIVADFLRGLGVNLDGDGIRKGFQFSDFFGFEEEEPGMSWNVQAMLGMGNNISDTMKQFVEFSSNAFKNVDTLMIDLFIALCIIDLALMVSLSGFQVTLMDVIPRLTKYAFFLYILSNWKLIVNTIFKGTVSTISTIYAGQGNTFSDDVTQPQLLLQKALNLIEPALNKIASFGARDFISNIGTILPIYIMAFIVTAIFIVVALYIMRCYIEFYLSMVFNLVSLPFSVLHWTKFVPEGTLNHLVNCTIKMIIITAMVGLSTIAIKDANVGDLFSATVDSTAISQGRPTDTTGSGYVQMIYETAAKYGVSGDIILAIAMRESGGDTIDGITMEHETGTGGGIMQILDGSQEGMSTSGERISIAAYFPNYTTDAAQNIEAGVAMYKDKLETFAGGDPILAIKYYGEGTDEYLNKVLANLEKIKGGDYAALYGNSNKNPHKITGEQLVKFLAITVILCAFAVMILRTPEKIMKQLGGSSGGVSLP
ncbi:type IV secretion system protein [Veillonella sp.]|uniref:type IV secretion system protein n=1 Tax=Veillonella sp. TaxID=1926307 RepID=UPI0025D35744|nr:type IV secretion system protein [Veillonella sp.]